ncbi:MAG TPA: hypothetical protein PLN52_04100 [Opitutaceae bacterium]|nr:hypothetical protein [Opitutaceae bacterium]
MSLAAPKLSPKSSLPEGLQDLLVREAAFALTRKRISEALAVAQEQKSASGGSKPILGLLFRDKRNDLKRKELEENLTVLAAGIQKLDAVIPRLQSCVDRSVENYLRELDAEYAKGLAASRFLEDWQRLMVRFDQAVSQYMRLLQTLLPLMDVLAANEICGANLDCRKLIDNTVTAARLVQEEVSFINKIADAQRIRSGVDAITLYRQPERNWKGSVHSLFFILPVQAAHCIRTLITESTEVIDRIREAIQGECQLASYTVGYGVTSYHQRVWASLRESAMLQIDPEQMESILAETEERMDRGALEPWSPPKVETPIEPEVAVSAPKATATPASTSNEDASASISAPPPGFTKPTTRSPELRIPSRAQSPRPTPSSIPNEAATIETEKNILTTSVAVAAVAVVSPAPAAPPAPAPSTPAELSAEASKEAADSIVDLTAERIRLEEILAEARAGIAQREVFLTQSEERLLQKSQEQLERETELEQREEQLRDLEKRLREKLGAAAFPPQPEKKPVDEFNE